MTKRLEACFLFFILTSFGVWVQFFIIFFIFAIANIQRFSCRVMELECAGSVVCAVANTRVIVVWNVSTELLQFYVLLAFLICLMLPFRNSMWIRFHFPVVVRHLNIFNSKIIIYNVFPDLILKIYLILLNSPMAEVVGSGGKNWWKHDSWECKRKVVRNNKFW